MAGLWLIASRRTSIAMLLAYAGGNPAAAAPSKLRPPAEVDGSEAGVVRALEQRYRQDFIAGRAGKNLYDALHAAVCDAGVPGAEEEFKRPLFTAPQRAIAAQGSGASKIG
jgi:hypothetical protein